MRRYDGSAWSTITGAAITGLPGGSTANIISIATQKRRLWFIMNQSTIVAFMPTDAITGAIAGTLDLGALWDKGGYCVGMATWTIDGGQGPQDYVVFISSKGQVAIYSGTDPTSATAWSIVGVFQISPPIGRRCFLRVGSDVAVITQQGVIPISQALPFDPSADRSVAITARIQNAMAQAAMTAQNNFGWQLVSYPNQQLAILNVPIAENTLQQQYVMNTITKSWCNFTGIPANCWELFNDVPYYGGNGVVVRALDSTYSDNGANINTIGQQAFNYFEQRGVVKYFTRIRPAVLTTGSPSVSVGMNVDFNTTFTGSPLTFSPTTAAVWDTSKWDVGLWGQGLTPQSNWQGCTGIGYCGSIQFSSASLGIQLQWASTDVVFQAGWAGI
jgi:hypothetical protein